MKKLFLLVIVCLLAMSNVWAGSQPQRTGAEGREIHNVDFYSWTVGTFTYIAGVAIAEVVNEVHPWIRIITVESPGSGPN